MVMGDLAGRRLKDGVSAGRTREISMLSYLDRGAWLLTGGRLCEMWSYKTDNRVMAED